MRRDGDLSSPEDHRDQQAQNHGGLEGTGYRLGHRGPVALVGGEYLHHDPGEHDQHHARGDELDRVVGLEIGADDYVVKPFSPREVAARVKAILKRTRQVQTPAVVDSTITSDRAEFSIDHDRKTIAYQQQLLQLTRYEYCLLATLLAQPGRVFSREQLLTAAGVTVDAGYDRSIDSHIKTLRAKLRQINPAAEPIKTQRGFGYCYQPESH